jgi:hypothetical protein
LRAAQVPSATELAIELTLFNDARAGGPSYHVAKAPTIAGMNREFKHPTADLKMMVVDGRGRYVPDLCADTKARPTPPELTPLRPGESVIARTSFDPRCFLLDPGERLQVRIFTSGWAGREAPTPTARDVAARELTRHAFTIEVPRRWPRPAPTTPASPAQPATHAAPETSQLTLRARQLTSASDTRIEVVLENQGPGPLALPVRPRVGESSPEHDPTASLWLTLVDRRGRIVIYRCAAVQGRLEFAPLAPRASLTYVHALDRGCYDLRPGEPLTAKLRFRGVAPATELPPGLTAYVGQTTEVQIPLLVPPASASRR